MQIRENPNDAVSRRCRFGLLFMGHATVWVDVPLE
jgi:hypothetical protein